MSSSLFGPLNAPPVFDAARAARTLEELASPARELLANPSARGLLQGTAGNSPYLAGLLLREPGLVAQFFGLGPDVLLDRLDADALGAADEADEARVMRRLRLLKRRAALTIALADLSGLYGVERVTAAMTRFADTAVTAG